MSGDAQVNIRARRESGFDFEGYAPVQGLVVDEQKEKARAELFHRVIHNGVAINVALLGFVAITWWIHGGFALATGYVAAKIPALWILAKYGMFSS